MVLRASICKSIICQKNLLKQLERSNFKMFKNNLKNQNNLKLLLFYAGSGLPRALFGEQFIST